MSNHSGGTSHVRLAPVWRGVDEITGAGLVEAHSSDRALGTLYGGHLIWGA